MPPTSRSITTLQQVIAVVPPVYIASPEDPATLLLSRPPLSGDLAAIVLTGSRIAGIVTVTRLRPTIRVMWPSRGLAARKGWRPPRPGRVVGVARYDRMAGETARFLVFVDASWRRAGLGTLLVCGLAELADLHDSGPLRTPNRMIME